jgi:hypothetical protein
MKMIFDHVMNFLRLDVLWKKMAHADNYNNNKKKQWKSNISK